MTIIKSNNNNQLAEIVKSKARYQKVMLIYGETVAPNDIFDIHQQIKEFCIYKESEIKSLDLNEVYNGYKLLIFLCSADEYLKLNLNVEEFVSIFIPQDEGYMPFFLNCNTNNQNYLVLNNSVIDINILSSSVLNVFINYFKCLITMKENPIEFEFDNKIINQNTTVETMNNLSSLSFVDIEILKKHNIEYKYLQVIDLIIINAFLTFLSSIREHSLMMVDIYKSANDDFDLIDKFYDLAFDNSFLNIINLNFRCLYNLASKTKEKVLENFVIPGDLTNEKLNKLFFEIKEYAKNSKGILSLLYLYNIFGV